MRRIKAFVKKRKEGILAFLKAFVIAGVIISGIGVAWAATLNMPDLHSFDERKIFQSTKIYDRTGEVVLFDFNRDVRRTVIGIDEMSPHIRNATIAIEDADFYEHSGIDFDAIIRAVLVNIASQEFSQGGSTITQQVVKNALLTPEKKISRKIKEWVLSIKLEQELDKERILEIYLNEIPYGGSIYGIEEASQYFFAKPASDLTIAESAYLAALPQAPTYYSPHGNNVDKLEQRKNLVLKRMEESGFITESEYEEALETEVDFNNLSDGGIKAPHFVFFVQQYLEENYGIQSVESQGLKVVTTLDYELQEKAQEIVTRYAHRNEDLFNAENAALVAVDPKTGQIITMVGSRGYTDPDIDGKFNAATSKNRQPGSSFKPFVYATAFNKGYTPETVVFDLKTQFSTACPPNNLTSEGNCYSPVNYDNAFRGPMTLRNALAQSVNIPAVKTLYLAGIADSIQTAKDMGISSLEGGRDRYGLSLVLGSGEVSVLEMTNAYATFANEGSYRPNTAILRIEDNQGNIIEEFEESSDKVLPTETSRLISDILTDNNARTPAFGANSPLYFPGRDVAVKTGTTNDYRDAWTLGYTTELAVGVWAGNNDSSSMNKEVAGFIVTPMWNEFMSETFEKYPPQSFNEPDFDYDGLKPILRGIWAGFEPDTSDDDENDDNVGIGGVHSILYWVNKDNPRGPVPSNPASDPQFALWEYPVQVWAGGASLNNFDGLLNDNEEGGDQDSLDEIIENVEIFLEGVDRS